MEWLENKLDEQTVIDKYSYNIFDLIESAQFKWIEDISKPGVYYFINIEQNKTIGSINFRNGFIKSAGCSIFNKKYNLKKKGLFDPRIIINDDNKNTPAATFYYYNWKGDGELLLADGEKYYWEPYDNLNNEWMFYDKLENELIHFKPITSFFKTGYYINIKAENLSQDNISTLISLGIFNLITSAEEVSDDAPMM
ncbi:MAG: hypothetical protein WCA84_19080 [Ignavibacteriaceae bacterium]